MGDYRLIDRIGLLRVAALAAGASVELRSSGCALAHLSTQLLPVADALERAAGDLRRRQIASEVRLEVSVARTDPRPFSMTGFAEGSERWRTEADHDAGDRVRASFLHGDWGGSMAARSSVFTGKLGTFSAAALIADGQAEGWVGIGDWGLELGGSVGVGAHLVQVEYGFESDRLSGSGEAFVGAEAAVEGELDLSPSEGDLGIELGLDAFCGIGAAASTAVTMGGASIEGGGEIGIGIGAEIDGAVALADGRFSFDFGASAFLGLGGGFDMALEFDLPAIGSSALEVLESTGDWIASLWP